MRTHGGRWAEHVRQFGTAPLDYSANTSPLGMSPKARDAAVAALQHADRYPDPTCYDLREGIARAYGLGADVVLAGNGAGDLIYRLALALRPRHALVLAPTFSEYRAAFEQVGCEVHEYPLAAERNFELDEGILTCITERLDVLVLCEPNNPTGRTTSAALMERIVSRCDATGTLLVADECFMDFLPHAQKHSLLRCVERHRVLVLRAFTKFYGMAGLRLGWCACADKPLLRRMADAGQPWSVSLVGQEAGIAALEDVEYARQVRAVVADARPRLATSLAELGCHVVPGEANYLLFRAPVRAPVRAPAPNLAQRLEAMGVLIRDCSDYSGLEAGWYRVAVRTERENAVLVHALREVFA
ncbi:MAG: threonine-phosphate decarboxylase [Atopobiaceae bacterium]|nr:threonine-phosphate decarboxylase [Atopobiaceae bacterium]